MDEQKKKPKWYYAQKVTCTKGVIIKNPKEESEIMGAKLYLDDNREIIYYPIKTTIEVTETDGIETELKKTGKYTIQEFLLAYPVFVLLAKDCKTKPQEITVTFNESEFQDKIYFKMGKKQFETLYYEKYHKDDKSNIEEQKTAMKKYEVDVEMPMKK